MKINPQSRTVLESERKTKNLLEVPAPHPKVSGSFNWRLIPKHLQALACAGVYFDDRILEEDKVV